jgi:hypothetical protein
MAFMSQDPNQNRVAGITGTEPKTPLERAKQIQEMQRAAEAQQAQPVATHAPAAAGTSTPPQTTASGSNHVAAMFDVTPVAQVDTLKGPSTAGADQAVYGAKQADHAAIFGVKSNDLDATPTGPIWKVIKFSTGEVLDLPKAESEYNLHVPPNAVKTKHGNMLQLTATPKAGPTASDPVKKKAVLVTDEGHLKGAEWGSKQALEKALKTIPSFATSVFRSVFDGVQKFDDKLHRILSVDKGSKSAYEVKIEQKNEYNGKWKTETVTLNNFGVRVPPSNDPRRHDFNVAMYYLDRFQAV